MRPKSLYWLLFFCFISTAVLAQSPVFNHLKIGTGKNLEKVQCMVQDAQHHLYFGTANGLYRYDGVSYRNIQISSSKPMSVTALAFIDNALWVGGSKGELVVVSDSAITPFNDSSYMASAKVVKVIAFAGRTCVVTYGDGIYAIAGDEIIHINTSSGLGDDYTYDAIQVGAELWIGTDAGISVLNEQLAVARRMGMNDGLPDNIVRALKQVNDSTVLAGMHDYGVAIIDIESMKFRRILGKGNWSRGTVTGLVLDHMNNLWVGTQREGVMRYNLNHADTACKSFTEINGLSSNRVLSLMEDAEHNVWMGTYKGASVYTGSGMEYLLTASHEMGTQVLDLVLDKSGRLVLSSNNGVHRFGYDHRGEGVVEQILSNDDHLAHQVVSMLLDSLGNIWMGTYGSGLLKYDPISKSTKTFTTADGLCNNNIMDLAIDQRGRLWMATLGGGVCYAEIQNNELKVGSLMDAQLSSQYIYALHIDRVGVLWIGTDGAGVISYDCQLDQVKPEVAEPLSTQTIYSIDQAPDGSHWFATASRGVYRLTRGGLRQFESSSGLRSLEIASIKSLPTGELVVAHSLGFDLLPDGGDAFIPYQADEDVINFEPMLNAAFLSSDGAAWFGGSGGVIRFDRSGDVSATQSPKVNLTGLRVLYQHVDLTQDRNYAHDENHFVFDFLGIWMKDPSSITYSYMLEGFDQQWSFETPSRVATYSSLPPGNYTFKVRARSAYGVWSDPSLSSYSFSIAKPFWQQWWFILLILASAVFGVVAFIRYRTQRLLAEKHRLEEEVTKRTVEITRQKEIIEFKNEEILASISYAKRIQEAILPPPKLVREHLQSSFILYKPKDIVAGDFYWMESVDDWVIFAAADCTGHGVPGAMVSVVCSNALNRAVREFELTQPAKILDKTLEIVIERFAKSEEEVKDGMDIAMCALNIQTNELQFAGANNPLWIIRPSSADDIKDIPPDPLSSDTAKLYEIKATKQPIGKYADPKPFVNHVIQLAPGDSFYVFSDGFPDQFGGEKGKKLKTKAFKQLLLSIQHQEMGAQSVLLDQFFEDWRGDHEQIDDVCVIGVRT